MRTRKGLGKGLGIGYKNLVPMDSHIHSLSAKGISTVAKPVFGKKIVDARQLTKKEVEDEGWFRSTTALILDDGTLIYPSQDDEGNDAGALFGKTPDGQEIRLGIQENLDAKGSNDDKIDFDSPTWFKKAKEKYGELYLADTGNYEIDDDDFEDWFQTYGQDLDAKSVDKRLQDLYEPDYPELVKPVGEYDGFYTDFGFTGYKDSANVDIWKRRDYKGDELKDPKFIGTVLVSEERVLVVPEGKKPRDTKEVTFNGKGKKEWVVMEYDKTGSNVTKPMTKKQAEKFAKRVKEQHKGTSIKSGVFRENVGKNVDGSKNYFYTFDAKSDWKSVERGEKWVRKDERKSLNIETVQDRDYYFRKGKDLSFMHTAKATPYRLALNPKYSRKEVVVGKGRDLKKVKAKAQEYMSLNAKGKLTLLQRLGLQEKPKRGRPEKILDTEIMWKGEIPTSLTSQRRMKKNDAIKLTKREKKIAVGNLAGADLGFVIGGALGGLGGMVIGVPIGVMAGNLVGKKVAGKQVGRPLTYKQKGLLNKITSTREERLKYNEKMKKKAIMVI